MQPRLKTEMRRERFQAKFRLPSFISLIRKMAASLSPVPSTAVFRLKFRGSNDPRSAAAAILSSSRNPRIDAHYRLAATIGVIQEDIFKKTLPFVVPRT